MDIYCSQCAEPLDNDELHVLVEEGQFKTYAEAATAFRAHGCVVVTGKACVATDMAVGIAEVYDLLGDDMDGAAAMLNV